MGMITKQKYLAACEYAIRQLVKTGSNQLSIIKGNEWIDVPFAEVLNWLEKEYKQVNAEAIPKEEVRQFIENIQKIKDNHNEYGELINYGTICGILIEGYRLLDKYRRTKDGKID